MQKIILMCGALALATPATAADKYFGEHGGYELVGFTSTAQKPAGCIMTEEFEGPGGTKLHIIRFTDAQAPDTIWMKVENYNWTTKADQEYEKVVFSFDDGGYERAATGTVSGIYHGLMSGFPAVGLLNIFAKTKSSTSIGATPLWTS